jgi:hypothetical protein
VECRWVSVAPYGCPADFCGLERTYATPWLLASAAARRRSSRLTCQRDRDRRLPCRRTPCGPKVEAHRLGPRVRAGARTANERLRTFTTTGRSTLPRWPGYEVIEGGRFSCPATMIHLTKPPSTADFVGTMRANRAE